MKNHILLLLSLCTLVLFSCKEPREISMEQVQQLEDSIAKAVPTVSTIHTFVKSNTKLIVILGDATFYNAAAEKKQQKAIQIGGMALRILGPENGLATGEMVVTKILKNTSDIPTDGIITDMKIDSLQKAMYGK